MIIWPELITVCILLVGTEPRQPYRGLAGVAFSLAAQRVVLASGGAQFARSSNKASVAVSFWEWGAEIVEPLPSDPPHVEIISTRNSQDNNNNNKAPT